MDEALSVSELENSFLEDLRRLNDRLLQYEYLLAISADMPRIPEHERTEENRVRGCQSGVWILPRYADGKVHVRIDSDALIVRGILSIAATLLDGRTPEEITAYVPRFIEETNIKQQLSADRFRGVHSVIRAIQDFAARHAGAGEPGRNADENDAAGRKKQVASLLFSSRQKALREAAAVRAEENPSLEFVHSHLKKYILARFLLEESCSENSMNELALLSLQRTMNLDRSLIRELDQAAPCDHATAESTKKALLLYAIRRDLDITPEASALTEAATVRELSEVVRAALLERRKR